MELVGTDDMDVKPEGEETGGDEVVEVSARGSELYGGRHRACERV
jgi:hypothetical protein